MTSGYGFHIWFVIWSLGNSWRGTTRLIFRALGILDLVRF